MLHSCISCTYTAEAQNVPSPFRLWKPLREGYVHYTPLLSCMNFMKNFTEAQPLKWKHYFNGTKHDTLTQRILLFATTAAPFNGEWFYWRKSCVPVTSSNEDLLLVHPWKEHSSLHEARSRTLWTRGFSKVIDEKSSLFMPITKKQCWFPADWTVICVGLAFTYGTSV